MFDRFTTHMVVEFDPVFGSLITSPESFHKSLGAAEAAAKRLARKSSRMTCVEGPGTSLLFAPDGNEIVVKGA